MSKLWKISSILILISIVSLMLVPACRPWESGMHLVITVSSPKDGDTLTTSPVSVIGSMSKHASVKINDVQVPGSVADFNTSIELTEGTNVINIVATATEPDERITKTVTVTYTPAK